MTDPNIQQLPYIASSRTIDLDEFNAREIGLPEYYTTKIPYVEEEHIQDNPLAQNEQQVDLIRQACIVARQALTVGAEAIRAGVTTNDINDAMHAIIVGQGLYPSLLNYYGFPKSVSIAINNELHNSAPSNRVLINGDIVKISVICYNSPYHGKAGGTFVVGVPNNLQQRLIQTVNDCLNEAIAEVKRGVQYNALGAIINQRCTNDGFFVVRSAGGHGIHTHVRCSPVIPSYNQNAAFGKMATNVIFTIEPTICAYQHREEEGQNGPLMVNHIHPNANACLTAYACSVVRVTVDRCEIL